MLNQNSLQKFTTKNKPVITLQGQRAAMVKPENGEAFICKLALENISVFCNRDDIQGNEFFIVSDKVKKMLKPRKAYTVTVYVIKTEDGKLSVHLIPVRTNNNWTLTFAENINAGIKLPQAYDRDYDAEIYIPIKCPVEHIKGITQEETDKALNAAFENYVIEDSNHPALEGLLKEVPKKVDVKPTKELAPVINKSELELDMSLFNSDGSVIELEQPKKPESDLNDVIDLSELIDLDL